jgi:UDP-N-acetylmuramate--alanine ligase
MIIDLPELDLEQRRRIHIVGIAGAGMSAIALFLARMGHRVSGSDLKDLPVLARLGAAGVKVYVGHDPAHVAGDLDAVVYSTAIPANNIELEAARARGLPVLHRAAMLRAIVAAKRSIAVAGSHGKTTTSSMLTLILRAAGLDPSFVIGADVNEVGTNAGYGAGAWLVVEADESDGTFLQLAPEAAVVTVVEPDHLDHYGGFDALVAAFDRFVAAVPGPLVACADDPVARRLAASHRAARTYGYDETADYRVVDYHGDRTGSRFTLETPLGTAGEVQLPLGVCNSLNAAGAAALALELGVGFPAVQQALRSFGGVARRFQYRGEVGGVTFIDDYAHLPSEVAAAIATAREGAWNHVIVVFQPHRYTRTASLWQDFGDAFAGADQVVFTDVYAAGERPIAGVSGRLLVRAVLDRHPVAPVAYLPRRTDLLDVPRRLARPGDVVLTLSAGDLTTLPDEWIARAAGAERS